MTEEYLLKCDHIFIVAEIARAVTDQSLKSSVYNVLAQHVPMEWEAAAGKYLNFAIVCTNSDVGTIAPLAHSGVWLTWVRKSMRKRRGETTAGLANVSSKR